MFTFNQRARRVLINSFMHQAWFPAGGTELALQGSIAIWMAKRGKGGCAQNKVTSMYKRELCGGLGNCWERRVIQLTWKGGAFPFRSRLIVKQVGTWERRLWRLNEGCGKLLWNPRGRLQQDCCRSVDSRGKSPTMEGEGPGGSLWQNGRWRSGRLSQMMRPLAEMALPEGRQHPVAKTERCFRILSMLIIKKWETKLRFQRGG